MASSQLRDIPQARVNITLDVDTGNGKTKKELPMKLLVLGDFSRQKKSSSLQKIPVNKFNLDQVIKQLSPQLTRQTAAGARRVQFSSINDFNPPALVKQVPELRRLLAMRHLLKDLKANLIDDQPLSAALNRVWQDKHALQQLRGKWQTT